jgi:hypothetical protein
MPKGQSRRARRPQAMRRNVQLASTPVPMNRQQRRAQASKKQERYRGLTRPTDNGRLNGSRKTGKAGY